MHHPTLNPCAKDVSFSNKGGSRPSPTVAGEEAQCTTPPVDTFLPLWYDFEKFRREVIGVFAANKFDGVLWDLDDTLYSRRAAVKQLFPHMFRQLLYRNRSDEFLDSAVDFMMEHLRPGVMVHPDAFGELDEKYPFDLPFSLSDCRDYYYTQLREYATPDPEAVAILHKLRSLGIKTGIITNITPELLDSQKKKVAALGIADLFDIIIYSAEFGVHKPDRGIFDHGAKSLGVSNDRCLFVGDDPKSDVAGALNAGMEVVWLSPTEGDGRCENHPRVHRITAFSDYFSFYKTAPGRFFLFSKHKSLDSDGFSL